MQQWRHQTLLFIQHVFLIWQTSHKETEKLHQHRERKAQDTRGEKIIGKQKMHKEQKPIVSTAAGWGTTESWMDIKPWTLSFHFCGCFYRNSVWEIVSLIYNKQTDTTAAISKMYLCFFFFLSARLLNKAPQSTVMSCRRSQNMFECEAELWWATPYSEFTHKKH